MLRRMLTLIDLDLIKIVYRATTLGVMHMTLPPVHRRSQDTAEGGDIEPPHLIRLQSMRGSRSWSAHQHQVRKDTNTDTSDEREACRPRKERSSRSGSLSIMDHFQRLGPSRFTGKGGPNSAEPWHSNIECRLESFSFTSKEMVTLAAFRLRNLACTLWRGVIGA